MDDFNSQFGKLSTTAAEWKPSGNADNDSDVQLNAKVVKEFVPGQGWIASSTKPAAREANIPSSVREYTLDAANSSARFETTVPTGPFPSPMPSFRALQTLGLGDDLWRHYRDISLESCRQMDPDDQRQKAVPLPYCNAYCLDDISQRGRSSFGYPSATFHVTSREDGNAYCLRRFDNVRCVSPKIASTVSDRWTSVAVVQEHPGIAPFYQCFMAQRAVFFVHQYIPGARSLKERLGGPLSECVLWSCISQLVSALRTIHGRNLAARTLQLHHILSNTDSAASRLRVRLNCLGIADVLEFEARKKVADLQRHDVRDLGRLILSLASGTEITHSTDMETVGSCEKFLAQNYSPDLHNLAMTLIRSTPQPPSILDVSRVVAQRAFDEQDAAYQSFDRMERALSAEYDSSRMLRILLKLSYVNERPEFGPNRRWAQSGDCYALTLFRDYVFHQADGGGYPVMDLGHVISALNKLDGADEEKIVLSSRDGKSLMVASYAEIARCLENAFQELCVGAVSHDALHYC
jgi:PAB-dependent poly(A)-specific ribonuclease subunit 3